MSTAFNKHPVIDLEKLFLDDISEILRLQQEFETNGWCFVRLSDTDHSFESQLKHINASLLEFFASDQNQKSPYLSSNAFGYSRVDHKEGIKLLTDQQGITDLQHTLPMNITATVQLISKLINDLTYRLKPIIIKLTEPDQTTSKQVELSPYTMLDIVHYFNRKTGPTKTPEVGHNTDEVNCVPHYDPGLFSLSILSTCDGLQLKDQRENKWIDGPNNSQFDQKNTGVIWLGEAASILTGNRLKSGIHRVVYPRTAHQVRTTIWQEVCTEDQIKQLLEQNNNVQRLPSGAQVMLSNQPDSVPMNVLPGGETSNDFMKRVESQRGLSMSKTMLEDINVSRPSNHKKTSTSCFSFLKKNK